MENRKKLSLALLLAGSIITSNVDAQTWDGSSVSTTTSTGTPQVGIGTATPTSDLEIKHDAVYNSSTPPGTGFGTVVKIDNSRDFGSMLPTSIPGTDYNIFEINNNDIFSGTGSPFTFFSVNTMGLVDIKRNLNVQAALSANATTTNTLSILGGDLHIDHPTGGHRVIRANTYTSGIGLYTGNNTSDGSSIKMNAEAAGGEIEFNSVGVSDMGDAFRFSNVDAAATTMTPIMSMTKTGEVSISKLATGTTKMVVADFSGRLGVQAIPVSTDNQTLSISGSTLSISNGNSVTLPSVSGADNLGNHTATTNLNMSLKDILACNKIRVDEVDLGTCKLKTTFQGASITASGGAALFVNGVPSSTSHKIYVYGSAYADGGTWQASDKNFKRNIEQLSTMKSKLFSIQPYSYYFKQEEFPERGFDNNIHYGFIAQDVEKIFPTMAKKEAGHYAINYTEFIPLLLQALKEEDAQVQQQQQTINQLQSKLAALNNNMEEVNAQKARINELENKLAALEANMDVCCQSKNATQTDGTTTVVTKSTLQQNTPNPFSKETRIVFNIVSKYQKAFIGIYNLNGEQVDKIFIEQGSGSINVLAGQLKPGMYVYSLVVDNDLVDSKKMVIIE